MVVPASIWIAVIVWIAIEQQSRALERRLQEDVELVGRAIRYPLIRAIESGRTREVASTLLSTLDIGRVYGVSVYDADGELIATEGAFDHLEVAPRLEDPS